MQKIIVILSILLFSIGSLSAQSDEATLILEHNSGVVVASWNSDESRILTASEDGQANVWSAETGESLLTIEHDGIPLSHAFWNIDDTWILTADESGLIRMSDGQTGETLQQWQINGMPLTLTLMDEESQLFAFTSTGNGAIWSTESGEEVVAVSRSGKIVGADINTAETFIRAWSEDGRIVAWDIATGETIETVSLPHRGLLLGIEYNDDDSRLLAWYSDGNVFAYESANSISANNQLSNSRHSSFVQQAIWSNDDTSYMSWAGDDTVRVRSIDNDTSQQMLRHEDWVTGARWNNDESRILTWSHIYVNVWNKIIRQAHFRHNNLVRGARWNNDGSQILSWSWDGTARVWQLED